MKCWFKIITSSSITIFALYQKAHAELEGLKKDLNSLTEKTEAILASPQQSSSSPILRSELDVTLKKMNRVYGLSSVYLDKWGSMIL